MKALQFTLPVTKDNSVIVQEERLPWFYNHLHRHKEIQITLIIKGEGTLIIGNYLQKFKPGNIFIIGANQPHIFKSDESNFAKQRKNNVHSLTLFFNSFDSFGAILSLPEMKEIKKFLEKTSLGMQVPESEEMNLAQDILKLREVKNGLLLADFIKFLNKLSHLRKWKILSTEFFVLPISDYEGLRMNDIYKYTIENYTRNIKLQQIAAVAHLSIPAFCRYFKKHTNKTYITFVNEIRISNACNKIIEGNFKSISSIAYDSGFDNITTFNRLFKKSIGISPIKYSKKYLQVVL
jgi:AraC-like DNA-binding protein